MGILSTGQARHFAMGGSYSDGMPPSKEFYDPTNINQGESPILPPLPATFSIPTQPMQGGYTASNMQGSVSGANPYYSQFDNNSNGLNFSLDDRVKELPSSSQPTNQIILNGNQQSSTTAPGALNLNSTQSTNNLPTSTSLTSSDNSGQVSFGQDYDAYIADSKKSSMPASSSSTSSATFFGNDYNAYLADAKKYQGKYRDSQSIDEAEKAGNISKEERDRLQLLSPEELQKENNTTEKLDQDKTISKSNNSGMFPYMSPLGTDFTSNMFQAGRAISAPKGTPGKALGIGLNLGAGFLEAIRGVSSGMGYQNRNDQVSNYYDDQMRKRLYTNAPQTQNANITGGVSEGRYGGLFQNNHFALGGEQMAQEQMMQDQMAQEEMPQEEQAMAQEQVAPQDKIQQIAEQLVSGLGSLEAIDAYLKEQQVDEATYNAIMQVAQQMIEGQNQSQPAMEEAPMEEAPTMRGGGKFKHRVGDKIEFTHKGKKHRGVIKKIENGQIYL